MIRLIACTQGVIDKTPPDYLTDQVAKGKLPALLINDGQVVGIDADSPAAGTARELSN